MMVANVLKRLVYASMSKVTAGNNKAGVLIEMSMQRIISPVWIKTEPQAHHLCGFPINL